MKASKFSDAQKAIILTQGAEGVPAVDICRKGGISQATTRPRDQDYRRASDRKSVPTRKDSSRSTYAKGPPRKSIS